ncbi:MAG: amidohydrolase [Actinomycetota bacterium]
MNDSSGSTADLVFVNGPVYTVDAARSWARAVAVKGGRILAVGSDDELREHIGPHTEMVDLAGRMLLPGFQDAHIHPPVSGLEMLRCNLSEIYALDGYLRIISDYAVANTDVPWILGGGWYMDVFPGGTPTKEVLDAIVPDRPAFLTNRDGHGAWVNSRALELAGITRETPDPADGRIERTAEGEPSGTLHEGAMELVGGIAPKDSDDDYAAGLRVAQTYLHSLGITAWQDAIVGIDDSYRTLDTYVQAAGRGELTARVVGALWWDRHRGIDQIDRLVDARSRAAVGRFAPTSVKIMQDGIIENFTAATLMPYLDAHGDETTNAGISFVDPELLKEAVTRLDALGFQAHFHALGDRAVREALDAIETALKVNGPSDNRHHLAHIQIVHPDDIPRFGQLGAVANGQPLWAAHEGQMDNLTIPFIGPDRASWQYPFASLVRAGAMLAFGSDWSVSSPDPLLEMHIAVERRGPQEAVGTFGEGITEVFLPEERIDLATAIGAFTMGTAYVNHQDDTTGSIEVGKFADLAVIDQNLFEIPSSEIWKAHVELTFVEGDCVFDASRTA